MNEDEVRGLQSALKALQRRQRREWVPVAGLSQSALRVVGAIARRGGTCQPRQIGEELQMSSSNVAAALRQLDAAGFISRQQDSADTRRVNVSLSETGAAMVASSRDERDAWLSAAITAVLDVGEQRTLLEAGHLLERLAGFKGTAASQAQRTAL